MPASSPAPWWLYMLRTRSGALYTGITQDIERRFQQHCAQGARCARFLRGQAPLTLVFSQTVGEKGHALRIERRVKALSKARKEALVAADPRQRHALWSSLIHEQEAGGGCAEAASISRCAKPGP